MTIKWYLAVAHRNSVLASVDHDKRDEGDNPVSLFRAEKELTELGCHVYYPRETIPANRLNRRIKIDRTLLYSYVFVGIPEGIHLYDVEQARGIYRILTYANGKPAPIDPADVERFRRNEQRGVYDSTKKRTQPFKPNERVRVSEGPFTGMTGLVRRCGRHNIVRVFLEGKHVVHFPFEHLMPA